MESFYKIWIEKFRYSLLALFWFNWAEICLKDFEKGIFFKFMCLVFVNPSFLVNYFKIFASNNFMNVSSRLHLFSFFIKMNKLLQQKLIQLFDIINSSNADLIIKYNEKWGLWISSNRINSLWSWEITLFTNFQIRNMIYCILLRKL